MRVGLRSREFSSVPAQLFLASMKHVAELGTEDMASQRAAGKRPAGPAANETPCKFKILVNKKPEPVARKPPKARDVARATVPGPPEQVLQKLRDVVLVAGIDIETHDEAPDNHGVLHKGRFGFFHLCDPSAFELRIVQLGWAIGGPDSVGATEREEYLVRPEGFSITAGGTKKHGITNERAMSEGLPLREVLERFMSAMARVDEQGGRAGAHHWEFDANIILRELENANLTHWHQLWMSMAIKGFCTMDPSLGAWLRKIAPLPPNGPLGLKSLILGIVPSARQLTRRHHAADADAHMTRVLYEEIARLCEQ